MSRALCNAPPITPELLARYREVARGANAPYRGRMLEFAEYVGQHLDGQKPHVPHFTVVEPIGELFDELSGDQRQAAYHLLWYVKEFSLGREPQTNA